MENSIDEILPKSTVKECSTNGGGIVKQDRVTGVNEPQDTTLNQDKKKNSLLNFINSAQAKVGRYLNITSNFQVDESKEDECNELQNTGRILVSMEQSGMYEALADKEIHLIDCISDTIQSSDRMFYESNMKDANRFLVSNKKTNALSKATRKFQGLTKESDTLENENWEKPSYAIDEESKEDNLISMTEAKKKNCPNWPLLMSQHTNSKMILLLPHQNYTGFIRQIKQRLLYGMEGSVFISSLPSGTGTVPTNIESQLSILSQIPPSVRSIFDDVQKSYSDSIEHLSVIKEGISSIEISESSGCINSEILNKSDLVENKPEQSWKTDNFDDSEVLSSLIEYLEDRSEGSEILPCESPAPDIIAIKECKNEIGDSTWGVEVLETTNEYLNRNVSPRCTEVQLATVTEPDLSNFLFDDKSESFENSVSIDLRSSCDSELTDSSYDQIELIEDIQTSRLPTPLGDDEKEIKDEFKCEIIKEPEFHDSMSTSNLDIDGHRWSTDDVLEENFSKNYIYETDENMRSGRGLEEISLSISFDEWLTLLADTKVSSLRKYVNPSFNQPIDTHSNDSILDEGIDRAADLTTTVHESMNEDHFNHHLEMEYPLSETTYPCFHHFYKVMASRFNKTEFESKSSELPAISKPDLMIPRIETDMCNSSEEFSDTVVNENDTEPLHKHPFYKSIRKTNVCNGESSVVEWKTSNRLVHNDEYNKQEFTSLDSQQSYSENTLTVAKKMVQNSSSVRITKTNGIDSKTTLAQCKKVISFEKLENQLFSDLGYRLVFSDVPVSSPDYLNKILDYVLGNIVVFSLLVAFFLWFINNTDFNLPTVIF